MDKLRDIFTKQADKIVSGAWAVSIMAATFGFVADPNEALKYLSFGLGLTGGAAAVAAATLVGKTKHLDVPTAAISAGVTGLGLVGLQHFVKPFVS